MNQRAEFLCWMIIVANSAGLITGVSKVGAAEREIAKESVASPPNKRFKHLEARIQKLEAALKAASKKTTSEGSGLRFQMVSVGKNVVILDTQTGETRVIEPQSEYQQQNVEIGKSWVTVTVLVNAPDRQRYRDDKQLPTKGK